MSDEILMELLYDEVHALVEKYVPREEPIFDAIWDSYWEAAGAKSLAAVDSDAAWSSRPTSIVNIGAQGGGADFDCMPLVLSFSDIAEHLLHKKDTAGVDVAKASEVSADRLDGRDVEDWIKQIIIDDYPKMMVRIARGYEERVGLKQEHARASTPTVYAVRLFNGEFKAFGHVPRGCLAGLNGDGMYDLIVDECQAGGPVLEIAGPPCHSLKLSDIQPAQYRFLGLILKTAFQRNTSINLVTISEWFGSQGLDKRAVQKRLSRLRESIGEGLVSRMIKPEKKSNGYRVKTSDWSLLWLREKEDMESSQIACEVDDG